MESNLSSSWDMDDQYEKLFKRMNPPRVVMDNKASNSATIIEVSPISSLFRAYPREVAKVILTQNIIFERRVSRKMLLAPQVDSANKLGILLEVVQVLTDLNLIVKKAYISSDGGWVMDGIIGLSYFVQVFHVTDRDGNKLKDDEVLNYICKSLGADSTFMSSHRNSVGFEPSKDHTSIELTGTDRPGLLSEVSAVLTDLKCNVVNAEVWTHNARAAAVIHVTDEVTGTAIEDLRRLSVIKELLCNVLKGSINTIRGAKSVVSHGGTHTERRLHQMMFADRDYMRPDDDTLGEKCRPNVTVDDWSDKEYSVVTITCKDRPKLLFDTVCTLTDLQYVAFHAKIDAQGSEAYQGYSFYVILLKLILVSGCFLFKEYCIRHIDGSPVNSEAERERLIQCLEAAIERRVSEGLKLELCTNDRVGLLSDVTRIFREYSLSVTRAEITTRAGKAVNTFYVCDSSGNPVDAKIIDSIRESVGKTFLQVKESSDHYQSAVKESATSFLFGGLFKSRSLYNFGFPFPYS
ncbi:hypothetical protein GIB67_001793 [Kingdonia uniflora]|uniref:ACT domain-containing protein ACR n=1 Tax=Kingdonia uniflora TaxID=39325 RepID=A0A7J7LBX1_9MAGN|nr:hypothetical protein GIB67_001793 [Kingdonia uniflora]